MSGLDAADPRRDRRRPPADRDRDDRASRGGGSPLARPRRGDRRRAAPSCVPIGGRDVAYALGSLQAARSGDPKPWLAAGLLVDGTDSFATMKRRRGPDSADAAASAGGLRSLAVGMNAAGLLADDD